MTIEIAEKLLWRIFKTRWPLGFTKQEREWLVMDTTTEEVKRFAPDLLKERD